jgi:hypothetical protein
MICWKKEISEWFSCMTTMYLPLLNSFISDVFLPVKELIRVQGCGKGKLFQLSELIDIDYMNYWPSPVMELTVFIYFTTEQGDHSSKVEKSGIINCFLKFTLMVDSYERTRFHRANTDHRTYED